MPISTLFLIAASVSGLAIEPSAVVPPGELDVAAEAFSNDFGVSVEEARARIEADDAISEYAAVLRERYKQRLTFISVEQHPDQHIVVGLKGPQRVATQRLGDSNQTIRVEFEEGYPYDESEFATIVEKVAAEAVKLIPRVVGVEGRPEVGTIRIHVEGHTDDGYRDTVEQLRKAYGAEIEVVHGPQ
jgi:hypothetical protein